jgi:hypothetical protein
MRVFLALVVGLICHQFSEITYGQQGKQFKLTARASQIDQTAKEHPELGYVFKDDKGKPADIEHASVDTRVAPRGELVIWLMGHSQPLFDRVNSYGQHAIQVHYANKWFGTLKPDVRDDGHTLGEIRLEAATGEDFSSAVDIPKPDGMKQRATQFVKWLAKENPEGKWEQFLNKHQDDLMWEKVIICGISHGSTTAGRFAKHQKVARVVMFSGPRDQYDHWQELDSATPANRYFGFTHVLDSGWTGDHYCRSWQLLELHEFGPLVDVDKATSPFENSRRLITNADVGGNADRAHNASIPGKSAVKNEKGEFIHEEVWRYLFTHPVDQVGERVPMEEDCRMELKKK